MKTLSLKTEIHALIEKTEDTRLLNIVKSLLSKENQKDWTDDLSEEEKQLLKQAMQESESGQLISHAVVMEEIKEKYSHKK